MLSLLVVVLGVAVAPGAERPAWKPESADLLFTSGRDGNSEIYLLRAGGRDWINLTKHASGDNWPSWSPDGTRVVYQNNRSGKLDVWTMSADGSNPARRRGQARAGGDLASEIDVEPRQRKDRPAVDPDRDVR